MALTDTAIRKAKAQAARYKLTDGGGLFVEIMPSGSKYFRYRFKVDGKESKATLGEYPAMSLVEARHARDEVKALVKQGINPNDHKKQQQADQAAELAERKAEAEKMTFSQLFKLWHDHNEKSLTYAYSKDISERIEKHLTPHIGHMALDDICNGQVKL